MMISARSSVAGAASSVTATRDQITGVREPVILTSRSAAAKLLLASVALASMVAARQAAVKVPT
jgi:hypothetical protein